MDLKTSTPPSTPPRGSLGIDFGTSNSAVAWAEGAALARALPLEGAAHAMPTALFFNSEDHSVHFGREAIALYLSGVEGRLMRSLKSLLGSPLLHEQTVVDGRQVSFLDVIAIYLRELRQRAGASLGFLPGRAVLGRPVHFVDDDAEKDRLAQTTLRQAALEAGFTEVDFQLEPIAAAFDFEHRIGREQRVLIADIGGGTSDFTVVRLGPQRLAQADRAADVLA
ncbi:MAG: heat-shock protein, partial [Betaproteobacteria bacterium HGW-Betaproteobacteria-6]